MMKLGTFVDFRKAFDVIDHNLLSKKLSVCGASQKVPGLVQSYLGGRQQFGKLGHIISEPKPVRQSVPQGSILRPVLFLLFVNGMSLRLSNSTIDADDTTLSLSANWNDITSLTHSLMYFRRKDQSITCHYAKRLQQKLNVEKANLQLRLNATRPTNIEHHKLLGY